MAYIPSRPSRNQSVQQPNSRYVQGGQTTKFRDRTGWWERRLFEERVDDFQIVVSSSEEGRPDKIAYNIYQKANLAWLVMQYNNIVDPIEELTTGTRLTLPSYSRVMLGILSRSTGGVRSNNT